MATPKGRYDNSRYKILDANGVHVNETIPWFSLRLDGTDPHAIDALATYAKSIAKANPGLSHDLWVLIEATR